MAKEKNSSNKYQTKADIERFLKSDKAFMNSHSAAEFDAYVEGAMWMMLEKQPYIDKLRERIKNNGNKILELENELAPYKELYEDYEFVERRGKKSKKKMQLMTDSDDEDDIPSFQDDDYDDIQSFGISEDDF